MNISELARELGVAVSTVSRVLSGNAEKYRISQKTVVRVQEAAEKFQVTPDPIGAGLRRGKMGIVGLLVPDITNSFFAQLARAIELRLRDSGVAVQLCDSAEDPETENALLEKMLGRRLDGLIVAPVGNSSPTLPKKLAKPDYAHCNGRPSSARSRFVARLSEQPHGRASRCLTTPPRRALSNRLSAR